MGQANIGRFGWNFDIISVVTSQHFYYSLQNFKVFYDWEHLCSHWSAMAAGGIFPAFYKYLSFFQLWLACDIKIRSENAQHLQYNYLGENGNFYAASEQQWRKRGANSPPPHHWFLFCFKLWPTDSSSVRSIITWSVTVQLLWWMRTCMQPVRNSGGRRGGANPPESMKNFHFPSCDFPRASILGQILPEKWQRNWFD